MKPETRAFRVLAVDDEPGIREFVARVLRQPGHEVAVAADGVEALQVAHAQGSFDLLVTDVMMPGMCGDELAQRMREADPDLKVLYLTGFSDQLFRARPLLRDNEAFLDKPVTVRGLLEAVTLLLEGHVPAPRPQRVQIPGARVRFGDCLTTLESLSVNGGLVRVVAGAEVGSTWPLVLELPNDTLRVRARVVSCERPDTTEAAAAGSGPFSLAFSFVDLSTSARQVLQRVIRDTADATQTI